MIFAKSKFLVVFAVISMAMLLGFNCTQPGAGGGGTTLTPLTFVSAVQTGGSDGSADSTELTLTFSVDPTTLAASDITVTGATKGALSGTGLTRTLAISDIVVANGANVTVAITSPSGFNLSGSPQTAVVQHNQL